MTHGGGRRLLCIGCIGVGWVGGCALPSLPPSPATTPQGRWRQDVRYLADNLARLHKNAFHTISRSEFEAAARRLESDVDRLAEHEIVVGMAGLVAMIGDGHTNIGLQRAPGFHSYPIVFQVFSDGTYVVATTPELESVLGGRLVRVGDTPLEEAVEVLAGVIPHENEPSLRLDVASYVRLPEVLHAVGLIPSPEQGTLRVRMPDGDEGTIAPQPRPIAEKQPWVRLTERRSIPTPVSMMNVDVSYWWEYLPESRMVYFAYNACAEMAGKPFRSIAAEALALVDQGGVDRFVIDLRNNGGGDSSIAAPLIKGLSKRPGINRPGGIFCLIGGVTYSSALLNAVELDRQTQAVFIGEPTGQKPNAYGEVRTFTLPNSRIAVYYSTKYFRIYEDRDPPSFEPDVRVGLTFEDYLSGRDPVLEAALHYDVGG